MNKFIFIISLFAVLLASCGSGGNTEDYLYGYVESWDLENADSMNCSGGLALAASSQFLFCSCIEVGGSYLQHYYQDGTYAQNLESYFSTELDQPTAISYEGQYLYIADKNNRRFVRKICVNADKTSEYEIGSYSSTYLAYGIDTNDNNHFLFWFNGSGDDRLEKTSLTGSLQDSLTLSDPYDDCQAVAVDSSGDVYLLNMWDNCVHKFSGDSLSFQSTFGSDRLVWPADIEITDSDEVLIINDTEIAVYDTSGNYQGSFGQFSSPLGITSYKDDVWIADWNNDDEVIYHYSRK